ncbi:unnamed protein product [Diabrotica balteata]|uniref:C-type lectin domain-containing protein n=1 Tax=Diabrotica balteata TaxID=107213 RepID=A0A9N9T999_DIABA|nr:unnamed protein product [Diabrotica balteata]
METNTTILQDNSRVVSPKVSSSVTPLVCYPCLYPHKTKMTESTSILEIQVDAENNWWSSGARSTDTVHWFWLSNGQLVNYTNWAISEPNNRLSEQCLALVLNKDKGLYFFDVGCHVEHPVICERPVKQSKLSKREIQKPWLKRAQAVKKQKSLGKYYIEQDFEVCTCLLTCFVIYVAQKIVHNFLNSLIYMIFRFLFIIIFTTSRNFFKKC